MHVSLLFPNEYLSAEVLQGEDRTLTIARLVSEELRTDHGTEAKWVLYFREMEEWHRKDSSQPNRKLVLNKTNAKTIAKLHGSETDDWVGGKIVLFPTTCMAFGESVGCIRVRPTTPKRTEEDAA